MSLRQGPSKLPLDNFAMTLPFLEASLHNLTGVEVIASHASLDIQLT